MKKVFFISLVLSLVFKGFGQVSQVCGTSEMMAKWFNQNPEAAKAYNKLQDEAEKADFDAYKNNYSGFRTQAVPAYTIPVVFHIMHLNGAENISDAQVMDAVAILNRDFRKLNSDTSQIVSEFKALAADVNFEFRLATKDEFGNCTNGIIRHYSTSTNWNGNFTDYIDTWSPSMYMNIYVVKTMSNGAAGYTFLPGSVPAAMDAIVILHNYVGSIGTSNNYLSRALTHEVGHWFNLQHTWGMTNQPGVACGNDGVSDTPLTKGFNWCNLNNTAICTPPNKENIQNYMDYSYCSKMFTIGQAARMNTCIQSLTAGRSNVPSNANLIATGVINPVSPCAPKADFYSNKYEVCLNGSVNFTDLSYNGTITNWEWTFPGGTSTNATAQNPTATFTLSGLKPVKLKVSNTIGPDSVIKNAVVVLPGPGSGTTTITQGFESITFPDNLWMCNVPKIGAGWIQTNTVGATSNKCVMIDNYFDSPDAPCVIYTPMFDLNTCPNPALTFDVAYSQNAGGSNDRLRVYYSTDCAGSWNTLYSKSGSSLHTYGTSVYASGAFLNPQGNKWRNESSSLGAISTASNVLFKFEFTRDSVNPGNNIYLDNINIQTASAIFEQEPVLSEIQIYPNPSSDFITLSIVSNKNAELSINLIDVLGKEIISRQDLIIDEGQNHQYFDLKGLAKGVYFVKIQANGVFYIKKLIID